ncbi:MAG: division plane positioning ATPase MipZ [Pseudomonadota bacterium]
MAHIIVVGNEKGGSGKSTTAMHVATALVRMGHSVGCLDLDVRQQSLGRYIENRTTWCAAEGKSLATPTFRQLPDAVPDAPGNPADARLHAAVEDLARDHAFLLIDCPGSHTRLAQVAHTLADTLITPLNDSFVDFDLLARLDAATGKILGPSVYSEMVWQARQYRAEGGLKPIDWIVSRNRLGSTQMHNKRKVGDALERLSKRIGFRVTQGFSERVIFRELFPRGLTLLDLRDVGESRLSLSGVAARQELRDLVKALDLPDVKVAF